MKLTRSTVLGGIAGLGAGAALAGLPRAMAATPPLKGDPEQKSVNVGISVPDIAYLGLYVAAAQNLWTAEGLSVNLLTFSGDASSTQALAGGSIDMNAASMVGFFNLFNAGQPVKVYYDIVDQAVFSFVGNPKVTKWSDLKGGTFGVASYGSFTAAMATVALEKNGLVVNRDVQLVQTGGSPNAYAALMAGQLSASTFSLPYVLKGKTAGLHVLGTQAQLIGPSWPAEVMYTKDDYLRANPKTVSAFLRGLVAADKLIVSQPDLAIKTLQDTMKLEPAIAAAAYGEVKNTFLERGRFPANMDGFWKVMIEAKVVTEPVAMSKWFDPTWVDNYPVWSTR